jgi:class 3 adenylate cyclase
MVTKKKSRYNLYVVLIIVSTAILAAILVVTSFKRLRTDKHFSRLILEENKSFLINTLRFGHDLMAQTGTERYEDLIGLALRSKFIYYLAILDNEGHLIAQSEPPSAFQPQSSYDITQLGDTLVLEETDELLLVSYEAKETVLHGEISGRGDLLQGTEPEDHRHPRWYLVGMDIHIFKKHYHDTLIQTVGIGAAIFLFAILIIIFSGILQRYQLAHLSIDRLQKIESVLSNFVPETAKRIIERDPDKALLNKYVRDATVLFLDIEGFTKLVQRYPQERINRVIESYFSMFFDLIQENGGDINETAGDGLMVIFPDPDSTRQAKNAVQTALGIQKKCIEVSKGADADLFPIRVNIGISSGQVHMGSTKIRGTGRDRWTFTASGSVTILAARLSEFGQGGQILVGEETAQRVRNDFTLHSLGKVPLKNLQYSGEIYRLKEP